MKKLVMLAVVLSLVGCHKREVYHQHNIFSNNRIVLVKYHKFIPMYKRVPTVWLAWLADGKHPDMKGS